MTEPTETEEAKKPATGNSARSKARRRAVEVLFEAEQRSCPAEEVLQRRRESTEQVINPYTEQILAGLAERQTAIDEFLQTYAQGWTLDRMPNVDRIILRVGAWELLYNDEVPDPVAVSEAMQLARTLSTDDSPQFVNGLLGRLQEIKPTLLA